MSYPVGTWPKTQNDLNLLHPNLKVLALKLQAECAKQGIPIKFMETMRFRDTQIEYYSWGRTKINPNTKAMTVITGRNGTDRPSNHQFGLAFDVFINIKGRSYDAGLLTKVGHIGKSLGLVWGGDAWKNFCDMPHFEKTYGLTTAQLVAGKRPAALNNVKEDEDMARKPTDKEMAYGRSSIDEMAKMGFISSPDVHYEDLPASNPSWKFWTVQKNVTTTLLNKINALEKKVAELENK